MNTKQDEKSTFLYVFLNFFHSIRTCINCDTFGCFAESILVIPETPPTCGEAIHWVTGKQQERSLKEVFDVM